MIGRLGRQAGNSWRTGWVFLALLVDEQTEHLSTRGDDPMICTNTATPTPAASQFRGTRHDFVAALAQLGARIELAGGRCLTTPLRRVRLACPLGAWANALGQPATTAQQYGPRGVLAYQAWEYQCDDGSVLCLGRQDEHADGTWWITLRAIHLAAE
jgi:hypothetical protein